MGGSLSSSVSNKSATTSEVSGTFKISTTSSYNHDLTMKITVNGESSSGTRDLKPNSSVSISKTVSVTRGTSAKSVTIKGYSATGTSSLGTISISKTVTVPARPYYTVKYNANGGSNAPGNQGHYHGYDLTITSKEPTRTGYTFKGWGNSASDTTVNYKPGGTYSKNESDTLYAIWAPKSITIQFNSNGGTFSSTATSKSTKADYASTFKFNSITAPSRTGYTFKGWATKASSTTAQYSSTSTMKINQTTTYSFYAVWEPVRCTRIFYANGGTFTVQSTPVANITRTVNYNDILNLNDEQLRSVANSDYEFLGWSTTKTDVLSFGEVPKVSYLLPTEVISINTTSTISYYAVWRSTWVRPSITYGLENDYDEVKDEIFESLRCTSTSIAYYDPVSGETSKIADLLLDDEGKSAYIGFVLKINQPNSVIKDISINIPSEQGSISFDNAWPISSVLPTVVVGEPGIFLPDNNHSGCTPADPQGACFLYIEKLDELRYSFEVIINNNFNVEANNVGTLLITDCYSDVTDIPMSTINLTLSIPSSLFIVDISNDGRNIAVGKVANKTSSPLYNRAFESQWPIYAYDKVYTSGYNNGIQFNQDEGDAAGVQLYMSVDGHFTIIKI